MNRINYKALVLLAAVLIAALLVGGKFVYGLFFITFFLILLCYIMGRSIYKNLINIVWKGTNKVEVGDRISISTDLYNSGLFPAPYLKVNVNLPQKLTGEEPRTHIYSIMSGAKKNIGKEIMCRHRGVYKVGHMEVEFSDILGIFGWKKVFDDEVFIFVYPRVIPLKAFNIPVRQPYGTVTVSQNAYEDFASTKDIRKYMTGDSLKKMHWKVTAHKGDFYVRNVELNASADLNIFFDLHAASYTDEYADDLEEKGAECAVSIIRYALTGSMSVNFTAKADKAVSVSGKDINSFREFMDIITKTSRNGDVPVWDLVKREARKLDWDATVVVITPYLKELPVDAIHTLESTGVDLVLIYICRDRNEEHEEIDRLKMSGIRVFIVGIQDDIRQVLGGIA